MDEPTPRPISSGWTSTRATHMWHVQHATTAQLLAYFGLDPVPDDVPVEWGSSSRSPNEGE